MNLWIRSQNGEQLTLCYEIHYSSSNVSQCGNFVYVNGTKFAEYKSKEKAIEIIDKIQLLIGGNDVLCINNGLVNESVSNFLKRIKEYPLIFSEGDAHAEYISRDTIIYEMPKD